MEKANAYQENADKALKGTGLRYFKDEGVFASTRRNLKSSILLASARESGVGLWQSCVEFEEVHSDTTRSLESTLNSKLGEVLESLKQT